MQASLQEKPSPDQDLCSDAMVCRDFQEQLKLSGDSRQFREEDERKCAEEMEDDLEEEEEEEEEEVEGEFSFTCGEAVLSPIAAEDAFINGQIKPVYPFFNGDVYLSEEESAALLESLPMKPPVSNIFVETKGAREAVPSTSGEEAQIVGPYCEWTNRKAVEISPEACKKSNSTGFSKIWRFKELMGRSNSDGRDAFVFLNNGHAAAQASDPAAGKAEKNVTAVKVKKVVKSKRAAAAPLSAHEVYLKSKAKEEERRRSYLPYRPELMGFFTNVNSGLSKNVHPF